MARPSSERALLYVEAAVGIAVVAAIVGRAYGAFPTLAFVLCGAALAYTGWVGSRMLSALRDPTLEVSGRRRDFEREKLEGEKRLLLQGIKDLEADRQTGKMDEAQYQRLRATAEARAMEIIRILRESDERWARAAEDLAERHLGPTPRAASPSPSDGEGATAAPSRRSGDDGAAAALPSRPSSVDQAASRPSVVPADPRLFPADPSRLEIAADDARCGRCGVENDRDARFCAGCGRAFTEEAAA